MGDIVTFRLAHRRVHAVNHAELVKTVRVLKQDVFVKEGMYAHMRPVFRNGLVTSLGALWRKQRRTIQPMFTKKHLETLVEKIDWEVRKYVKRFSEIEGSEVDMYEEMLALTMRILTSTMFSDDVSDRRNEISKNVYFLNYYLIKATYGLFPPMPWIPTANNRRFKKAMSAIDGIIWELIEKRKSEKDAGNDFLGMLMQSKDPETGKPMPEAQIRDEAVSFFLAGHETTAAGLAWTFYLLDRSPAVAETFYSTLEQNGLEEETSAKIETIKEMDSVETLFSEAMRLYPPIHVIFRQANADTELGGVAIKKGDTVVVSPYALHRDARYWKNPESFDPERFARGEPSHKYAYIPFGGGPRSCIGSHFAMMEA